MLGSARRSRRAFSLAALGAVLLGLVGSLLVAVPANAAPTSVFSITQAVTKPNVVPGDSFTYTVTVNCSPDDCPDATLVDVIPPQFDALTLSNTVAVTGGPSSFSWGGTNNRTLTVSFLKPLDGGGVGLQSGSGYSVQVTMAVPGTLGPDWASNGVPVTNTAVASSPNAPTAQATRDVTVTIPYVVDTTLGATWTPSPTQYKVGEASAMTLTTANTSNAAAQSLTLLAPTDPTAAGNFFEGVNLTGFGTVVYPTGADRIQVDAWVNGAWVNGAAAVSPALDATVTPGSVTGLRVIFTSSTGVTIAANGSVGSVALTLAQRAAQRTSGVTLVTGTTFTAAITGTVVVPGQTSVSKATTASYIVHGLDSKVIGGTTFTGARIPAGTGSIVAITGQNASNGVLSTLTITEPATNTLLDANIVFDGFRVSGSSWPAGATSAAITWYVTTGTAPTSPDFTSASGFPALPALATGQRITGFSIVYSGSIATGATASVPFRVAVDAATVDAATGTKTFTNKAQVDGYNDAGPAISQYPTASLIVMSPAVSVDLNKTVTPASPIPAGGRSLVRLTATTSSDSGYVSPTSIVVEDSMTTSTTDYWRAFNAVAVAPTQVPLGSTLTVSYQTTDTIWHQLAVVDATSAAQSYSAALPAPLDDIIGLRFLFANANGYSLGTTVRPYISFRARSTMRGSMDSTATDGAPVTYSNTATAHAIGIVTLNGEPKTVEADSPARSSVAVVKTIPAGSGGLMFDKTWVLVNGSATVNSQSSQQRDAMLSWGTEIDGYSSVVVADPVDATAAVSQTIFQSFDLIRIKPITTTDDPLIAYDRVTKVELFDGTSWVDVNACATAANCLGRFTGYTLTGPQAGSTVGVRVTFAEWATPRSTDPLAPPVGSGVASGPSSRPVSLVFQLRNKLRDVAGHSTPWITESTVLNAAAGIASNSARLTATGTPGTFTLDGSDTITIIDNSPNVGFAKIAGTGTTPILAVPNPLDVAATGYPTTSFTTTATNTSLARAWFLRVSDVMPCTTTTITTCVHNTVGTAGGYDVAPYATAAYDSTTNPFERLLITKVTLTPSTNSGIDLSKSVVTLWKYNNGVPTTTTLAANSASLAVAATFTDVVGVSVLYTGTDTSNGGTIVSGASVAMKFDVRLRQYLRSDATTLVTPTTITNSAFTQIWDNVLADANRYDSKSADVSVVAGSIRVSVTKALSATTLLEKDRANDIIATLTGGYNNSTVSPREVVIQDNGSVFWNTFGLRSLGAVTTIPTGANRLRIDYQLNGGATWVTGTTVVASNGMVPTLPGVTLGGVTGLRYVFSKADGTIFSTTAPAQTWSSLIKYTVRLRDSLLSTSAAIAFPSSVAAPVSATSTNDSFAVATATGSTSIALDPGTFTLDVEKRPTDKVTTSGAVDNFSLIFGNTGTGFLNNPVVIDSLPVDATQRFGGPLLFDPTAEITYTTSTGGLLPVTGVTVAYDSATRKITFNWPAGSRMAPGEKYTILLPLQVAPGLISTYGAITNSFGVSSDRTLSSCTNTSGNGKGSTLTNTNTRCNTVNDVTTISASAISTFKGVKGNVDASNVSTSGAANVTNPANTCVADSQGFYRSPCAANTVIGATDLWKLQVTNGGNIASDTAMIVDVLPKFGDTYLTTGSARLSAFAPIFTGGLALAVDDLSTGTSYTYQVSTVANPCPNFTSDPTCDITASWQAFTGDYASVKAIRVVFDFTATASHNLAPGAAVSVTYTTVNTPTTAAGDGRAPVSVPVTNARAWNSFGAYATFGTGNASRSVEPVKAGVQLATGPLSVTKAITGSTAAYAPTSYQVTVSCTVSGATVSLPAGGVLTLAATNAIAYTGRIDGIPVGAVCRVVENTTGASSVAYSPAASSGSPAAEVTITLPAASSAAVPAAQQATVTNSYGTTELLVTKAVTHTTTVGAFGPFDFTLACTVNNGTTTLAVPLAAADAAFTLADGEQKLVQSLPVTAVCGLRETNSDNATKISVKVGSATATTVTQNQAVSIPLGTSAQYTAAVTNSFAGGQLTVTKTVDGAGGTAYGTGPFTIHVACTYNTQMLFDDSFTISNGESHLLAPVFPVGTSCAIDETNAGGASTHSASSSVTIPGPVGVQVAGLINAGITNTFTIGSLEVDKTVLGAGKAAFGAGPFTAQVICTWQKSPTGLPLTIPLSNSGYVTLDAGHAYTATVTGLIAGASCSVVETAQGGANNSTVGAMSPAVIPANGTSVVSVTNTFTTGSLTIIKTRTGAGASQFGAGPFTVAVSCAYQSNGSAVAVDLGSGATQVLGPNADPTKDYRATIDGILTGATCTVTETDAGLAVSSASSPADGTVTIVESGTATPASVTVTNTFLIGQLHIEKTPSVAVVQGDTTFDYSFTVSNVGPVDAAGVKVIDAIPATLKITAVTADSTVWTSCAVTGKDSNGYGGTLECHYAPVLAAGNAAVPFSVTAHVNPLVAQDTIVNVAVTSSTTRVVAGDEAEARVDVKWLDGTAVATCVKDAPYLDYSINAHNVAVVGKTVTITWADVNGNVIHTDTLPITASGVVSGSILWPGAEVNADGVGIGWPGWRPVLPGETPQWQNLKLDPSAYGYGLRADAVVTISINATTSFTVHYPPSNPTCGETPAGRKSSLWLTKTASQAIVGADQAFTYRMSMGNHGLGAVEQVVLVDVVPSTLKVSGVNPADPATGQPGWVSCTVTNRNAAGYGGTVTCDLDRPLGALQDAPDVLLSVMVDPSVPPRVLVNTATLTAIESSTSRLPGVPPTTLTMNDSATVVTLGTLAMTGFASGAAIWIGFTLLLLGGMFTVASLGRRRLGKHHS